MTHLAGIIILGILSQWLAWRVRVPAILPLIFTGLLVGPVSTLFTPDGEKLLNPIYNTATGTGLFPGEYLFYFVSLAIGVILFEGGLTLKRREIAGVGPAILRLITMGAVVTFLGAGLGAHFIMGLSWQISFLFAALVIVTGPTVIAPILQNIPLTRNISTVLKWEGILIDPVGALVAVLVFEFIRSSGADASFTSHALVTFGQIIFIGLAIGASAALALYWLVKQALVPHYLLNVFTLALVLGVFVLSHMLAHESGLLSVVVMGMVLGNLDTPWLREVLSFKESLSVLLISILFILLAANIDMQDLELIARDWRSLWLFLVVVFVLRPLGVFLSTRGSDLNFREKLFISWVGPRGIVAAGIASLFGITLVKEGVAGAQYITPLVFMIVLGTVTINAALARPVARWLRVIQQGSEGVLIVGANQAARIIARYLREEGRHVVLVDSGATNVGKARDEGLEAYVANVYHDDLSNEYDLLDMGYLLALTSNSDINEYAVSRYRKIFGENGAYRLISAEELTANQEDVPQQGIFSYFDDFLNISEAARDFPQVYEVPLQDSDHFLQLLQYARALTRTIPLFVKDEKGQLLPIEMDPAQMTIAKGSALVCLGLSLEDTMEDVAST